MKRKFLVFGLFSASLLSSLWEGIAYAGQPNSGMGVSTILANSALDSYTLDGIDAKEAVAVRVPAENVYIRFGVANKVESIKGETRVVGQHYTPGLILCINPLPKSLLGYTTIKSKSKDLIKNEFDLNGCRGMTYYVKANNDSVGVGQGVDITGSSIMPYQLGSSITFDIEKREYGKVSKRLNINLVTAPVAPTDKLQQLRGHDSLVFIGNANQNLNYYVLKRNGHIDGGRKLLHITDKPYASEYVVKDDWTKVFPNYKFRAGSSNPKNTSNSTLSDEVTNQQNNSTNQGGNNSVNPLDIFGNVNNEINKTTNDVNGTRRAIESIINIFR